MKVIKIILLSLILIPLAMFGQPETEQIRLYPHIRDLIHRHDIVEAQKELDAVKKNNNLTEEDPTVLLYQSEIWIARANQFYDEKKFSQAMKLYKQALRFWPNHPIVTARYKELSEKSSVDMDEVGDSEDDSSKVNRKKQVVEVPKFYAVPEVYSSYFNSKRKHSTKRSTNRSGTNSEVRELIVQLRFLLAELTKELQALRQLKDSIQTKNEEIAKIKINPEMEKTVPESKVTDKSVIPQSMEGHLWAVYLGMFAVILAGIIVGLVIIGIFAKFASSMFFSPQIIPTERKLRSSSRRFESFER